MNNVVISYNSKVKQVSDSSLYFKDMNMLWIFYLNFYREKNIFLKFLIIVKHLANKILNEKKITRLILLEIDILNCNLLIYPLHAFLEFFISHILVWNNLSKSNWKRNWIITAVLFLSYFPLDRTQMYFFQIKIVT